MDIAEYDQLPSRRVATDGGEMFSIDVGGGPAVPFSRKAEFVGACWRPALPRQQVTSAIFCARAA